MARKKVRGFCRLCKTRKLLCKSHYISRALYKLCRQDGEDPVVMTPKVVMTTPRQLWAHLLCHQCEGILNKRGENAVLKLVDNGSNFPLLERMRDAVPLKIENGTTTFSGNAMRIDTDALAHFALGLLWKAAVYPWSTLENQIASVDLGGIEDGIRTYLLGKNEFPAGLFVLVAACEDIGSRGMVWAPSKITGLRTRMFSILVRGLWFHIALNQDAPAGMKELCCVQSANRVLHRENCTERFLDAGRPIYRTARIASNLRRPS